jgi:hypothetical protein
MSHLQADGGRSPAVRLAASSLLCLETTAVGMQLDELGAVRTGRSTALASGPIINAYDGGAFEWDLLNAIGEMAASHGHVRRQGQV